MGTDILRSTDVVSALGYTPSNVVNVVDFGARFDGSTDDSAAINAAFAYVRTTRNGQNTLIVFPQGAAVVRSTLNWTGLKSKSITIEGAGSQIIGKISGQPIIDALSTEYLRIKNLTITGDASIVPSIGIQIGRAGTTVSESADNIVFDKVALQGSFSFTAVYNLNAETSLFDHLLIVNGYNSATSYGIVLDGLNHFNAASAFVTVTAPVDTPESFNENVFLNCDIRHNSNGVPIWMANTTRHRWIGGYAAAVTGAVGVQLFSFASSDENSFLDFDVHVETPSVVNTFLITGPNATPRFTCFKYRDQVPNATAYVFAVDTGVTSVNMLNVNWEIGALFSGAVILDAPLKYTISGSVYAGGSANFNYSTFFGLFNSAGSYRFITNGSNNFTGTTQLSRAPSVTAAGSTQGTATALTADLNNVTTVASGTGVILGKLPGQRQEVWNNGANALLVYPASGAAIGSGSANAAVSLAVGSHATFVCFSSSLSLQY